MRFTIIAVSSLAQMETTKEHIHLSEDKVTGAFQPLGHHSSHELSVNSRPTERYDIKM